MQKPSRAYYAALEEAKQHHASSKTYSGKFLRPHAPAIKRLIDKFAVGSVLDYGCGKGDQYSWVSHGGDASIPAGLTLQQYWGVPSLYLYDPAVPKFAIAPPFGVFGMVICTHTLGSIPVQDLQAWVIPTIYRYAVKCVYIAEKLGPVEKQVFSNPELMPRNWSREEWRALLAGVPHAGLHVELATHERINGEKIVTHGNIDAEART